MTDVPNPTRSDQEIRAEQIPGDTFMVERLLKRVSPLGVPAAWERIKADLAALVAAEARADDQDRRIDAAIEWGRANSDTVDVMPLFRALGVVR